MRVLALFSFSFAGAVGAANYLLPEWSLLPVALLCLLTGALVWRFQSKRPKVRRVAALVGAGLALGLAWTALYTHIFFQPAREMDDRTLILTGTVSDWPQETDYGYSVLVRADTESFVKVTTLLYTDQQGADLRPGDRIEAVTHCTLGDRTFAGEEITYYTAKGVFLRGEVHGLMKVDRPDHISPRHWTAYLARAMEDNIDRVFSETVAPLVCALVTGNRETLSDEFTTSLQRTGLAHTVAVSGMHLAFLSGLLALVLGRGRVGSAVITLVWVVLFCGVAGNTPSVLRAAVMVLLVELAPLLSRELDSCTSLAFALFLLLAWNPFSATHVGLQLSFAAVAGILLAGEGLYQWLLARVGLNRHIKNRWLALLARIPKFFLATFATTLGASILTVPLVALYFEYFSLISPLSNLLTLWAVGLLFCGGLLVGIVGLISSGASAALAFAFTPLARYLTWVVEGLDGLSMAAIPLRSPYYKLWFALLCLLVALTLVVKGKKRPWVPVLAGCGTLTIAVALTLLSFRAGEMTTAVLDVGQGQSVLIGMGDYLTLVDCGGDSGENPGDVAADYIQTYGGGRLDLLVLSHYHSDHANGIPRLLERIKVDTIALPDVDDPMRDTILALAEEKKITLRFIREETDVTLGEAGTVRMFPPLGTGEETNELGLTVLASAGDFDLLLTGDMDGETEQLLLERYDLPQVELLVVGHHGSKYSTTQLLLDQLRPERAVISVGKANPYGHPSQEVLERLDGAGVELYRTDLQGTIRLHAPGKD